jgi:hypothetical protein
MMFAFLRQETQPWDGLIERSSPLRPSWEISVSLRHRVQPILLEGASAPPRSHGGRSPIDWRAAREHSDVAHIRPAREGRGRHGVPGGANRTAGW